MKICRARTTTSWSSTLDLRLADGHEASTGGVGPTARSSAGPAEPFERSHPWRSDAAPAPAAMSTTALARRSRPAAAANPAHERSTEPAAPRPSAATTAPTERSAAACSEMPSVRPVHAAANSCLTDSPSTSDTQPTERSTRRHAPTASNTPTATEQPAADSDTSSALTTSVEHPVGGRPKPRAVEPVEETCRTNAATWAVAAADRGQPWPTRCSAQTC